MPLSLLIIFRDADAADDFSLLFAMPLCR